MPKISQDKRFDREYKRLKNIFEDIDHNKLQVVDTLIARAAFITISLQDLEATISEQGWVEEYQNGESQKGLKKSAAADVHISLTKNLNAIVKQLVEIVPPAQRKSKLQEMMEQTG